MGRIRRTNGLSNEFANSSIVTPLHRFNVQAWGSHRVEIVPNDTGAASSLGLVNPDRRPPSLSTASLNSLIRSLSSGAIPAR